MTYPIKNPPIKNDQLGIVKKSSLEVTQHSQIILATINPTGIDAIRVSVTFKLYLKALNVFCFGGIIRQNPIEIIKAKM